MNFSLIAAMTKDYVIGNNEFVDGVEKFSMPWPWIKEDMLHFQKLTKEGGSVIGGRKTFDSLPDGAKPFIERQNIFLTRDENFSYEGIQVAHSMDEALKMVQGTNPYVIGGGEIYKMFLDSGLVNKMEITWIHGSYHGNVKFPEINWNDWSESAREDHTDEKSGVNYSFSTYIKK